MTLLQDVRSGIAEEAKSEETQIDPQLELLDRLEREVPDELRDVMPGIPRDPATERFYAREYPLRNWQKEYAAYTAWKNYSHLHITKPYKPEINERKELGKDSHKIKPAANPIVEKDLTLAVRLKARELGISLIGFAPYDSKYTYWESRKWVRFDTAIVLFQEQDYEATQKAPLPETETAGYEAHLKMLRAQFELAEFIRARGYHVQVHAMGQQAEVIQPNAVAAGLGQMGANGQLLSPIFGSRSRLQMMTTDAPLRHDRPRDYGIPKLCEQCQVCVNRCPGRALNKERVQWRGILKFKAAPSRCAPILTKYNNCSICVKTCPIQKYGYETVISHYKATGEILGKGTDELEEYTLPDKGYFPTGQRPIFTKEELKTPGIKTNRGM
ncbi:MAG: hypothetical protein HY329_07975 [Chloroflexi bacterium]|nr:hypothetical protein [Chloroflexota bacterium]